MTLAPIPGWSYATSVAVYFARNPDAKLLSAQLRDMLEVDCTLSSFNAYMRPAMDAGIVAKTKREGRHVHWVIGPVLRRRLQA